MATLRELIARNYGTNSETLTRLTEKFNTVKSFLESPHSPQEEAAFIANNEGAFSSFRWLVTLIEDQDITFEENARTKIQSPHAIIQLFASFNIEGVVIPSLFSKKASAHTLGYVLAELQKNYGNSETRTGNDIFIQALIDLWEPLQHIVITSQNQHKIRMLIAVVIPKVINWAKSNITGTLARIYFSEDNQKNAQTIVDAAKNTQKVLKEKLNKFEQQEKQEEKKTDEKAAKASSSQSSPSSSAQVIQELGTQQPSSPPLTPIIKKELRRQQKQLHEVTLEWLLPKIMKLPSLSTGELVTLTKYLENGWDPQEKSKFLFQCDLAIMESKGIFSFLFSGERVKLQKYLLETLCKSRLSRKSNEFRKELKDLFTLRAYLTNNERFLSINALGLQSLASNIKYGLGTNIDEGLLNAAKEEAIYQAENPYRYIFFGSTKNRLQLQKTLLDQVDKLIGHEIDTKKTQLKLDQHDTELSLDELDLKETPLPPSTAPKTLEYSYTAQITPRKFSEHKIAMKEATIITQP